ncbi:TIGR00266 family protein [Niveispirillum fermenti]|uniref:TIGR00266 family protein n=1 Tax=Niveispirillum fermenti TaxID=1233113 RepID=UPI003A85DC3B
MTQWFFHDGDQRVGPLDGQAALDFVRVHPDAFCWRNGMAEWLPVRAVGELSSQPNPWAGAPGMPPPPGARSRARADDIDFKIHGQEMQFVEVELDPGESAIAEAGAMVYKDASVQMNTIFGDGNNTGGFLDKLIGAGKRVITGESLFTTVFTHTGRGKAHVAFSAPYPGTILPLNLADLGGTLICQKDSFLAAAKGVSIGIHFQRRILTGLFGGEGFIMQKLTGDGWVFAHVGGSIMERELAPGEVLHIDTGCVAAFTPDVDFDLVQVGGVKSVLFGGEGLFFATLRGPGRVWIQSLPFSRLAGRMLSAAMPGASKGEGSMLGPLGDIVMGNKR